MRKKFIAGAKCPECGKEDKIFVCRKDGEDVAECNACGYTSVRPKEVEPEPEQNMEPSTEGVVKFIK